MVKNLFLLVFSLVLTSSILAPTVLTLIEQGQENGLVLESQEGESKDGEKKYDEKELFFESVAVFTSLTLTMEKHLENSSPLYYQGIDFEIILPPPKGPIA